MLQTSYCLPLWLLQVPWWLICIWCCRYCLLWTLGIPWQLSSGFCTLANWSADTDSRQGLALGLRCSTCLTKILGNSLSFFVAPARGREYCRCAKGRDEWHDQRWPRQEQARHDCVQGRHSPRKEERGQRRVGGSEGTGGSDHGWRCLPERFTMQMKFLGSVIEEKIILNPLRRKVERSRHLDRKPLQTSRRLAASA